MFQLGDLVFAKCTKPWPAKIMTVFNETTFKVDFYNHNSFAIVDHGDLELLNQATIQYYREKYKKKRNKEESLAFEGISIAEGQFKRREDIRKIESKKWKQGVPNADQKRKYQQKIKNQIKRPVIKPKQSQKKQNKKEKIFAQQKEKEIKSKTIKTKQAETANNQKKIDATIKTRSKSVKNENLPTKLATQIQLRDTFNQKSIQIKSKDVGKQKKIKKKSKLKKFKKLKEQKKTRQKQSNKDTTEQFLSKTETFPNQSLQSEGKDEKQIQQQSMSKWQQNIQNSSSMILERESFTSSMQVQKSHETVKVGQIDQILEIQTNSLKENKQQARNHEFQSILIQTLKQENNAEIENKNKLQTIAEKDRNQQTNPPLLQSDFSIQFKNQQIIDQHLLGHNQPVKSTSLLQDQNNNQMQIQETVQEESNKQNNELKMTFMNNLDLSISSFEISESQDQLQPQNIPVQVIQPPKISQLNLSEPSKENHSDLNMAYNQIIISQNNQTKQAGLIPQGQHVGTPNQLTVTTVTDNLPQERQQRQQNEIIQKDESSLNQKAQIQNNLDSISPAIQEGNIAEIQSAQEDQNQSKCNQNQQLQQTFQNLTPVTPNLLHKIINHKITQRQNQEKISLDSPNQPMAIEQPKMNVQAVNEVMQAEQKQSISVNSSMIANNVNAFQVDLKDIQISSNTPEEKENAFRYFERIYGDFSINNRDYIKMVRGLPELKKELQNTDCKLMAICTNQYLEILLKFIAPQNSKRQMKNLEMWQRQLLIGILDTDILNLKTLVEYEIMFKMMSFISAFEQNKTAKRAQCHVQYLFVVSRLDTYLNRYIKQRYKEGLMHKVSSYDQLIREFNQRIQT